MPNTRIYLTALLPLVVLAACGTTKRFVAEPHLTIDDPQKDARQAIGELFQLTPPYKVTLCEADLTSKECVTDSKGITAKGMGGLLLPLTLQVTGMSVKSQTPASDGLSFNASLDAKVDSISPLCGTVGGKVLVRENNTVTVQFRHFYCNWVVVGNVLVNADLSMDSINLKDKVVTGFYKLTFYGTGNAAGSGYYRATLVPERS